LIGKRKKENLPTRESVCDPKGRDTNYDPGSIPRPKLDRRTSTIKRELRAQIIRALIGRFL
jgi:hypothetical protein